MEEIAVLGICIFMILFILTLFLIIEPHVVKHSVTHKFIQFPKNSSKNTQTPSSINNFNMFSPLQTPPLYPNPITSSSSFEPQPFSGILH